MRLLNMDLEEVLAELMRERDLIDRAIANLENFERLSARRPKRDPEMDIQAEESLSPRTRQGTPRSD